MFIEFKEKMKAIKEPGHIFVLYLRPTDYVQMNHFNRFFVLKKGFLF